MPLFFFWKVWQFIRKHGISSIQRSFSNLDDLNYFKAVLFWPFCWEVTTPPFQLPLPLLICIDDKKKTIYCLASGGPKDTRGGKFVIDVISRGLSGSLYRCLCCMFCCKIFLWAFVNSIHYFGRVRRSHEQSVQLFFEFYYLWYSI